jgi:hypothetical protein
MSERSFRRDRERRIAAARRRDSLRARKAAAAAAVTGAFVLASPAASSAATFVVNQTSDGPIGTTTCDPTDTNVPCNLRDAIAGAAASAGADDITFDSTISGDTITLNSGRLIVNDSDPLNIFGGPTPDSIYVDGDGASMVFDVQNTYNYPPGLTISGMTIQNGSDAPAGGIYAEQGTVVNLANSTVTGNQASGAQVDKYAFAAGGGITNRGTMTVQDSTVYNNDSYASGTPFPFFGGGGIDNLGQLTISGSTVDQNYANQLGGGIFQGFSKYPSSMKVSDTTVSNNYADYGGGISSFQFFGSFGSSHNQVTDSTISGNTASDTGGGLGFKYLGGSERWLVSHSTVSGNNAYNDGGGLGFDVVDGSFELLDSTVSGNDASDYGGGAYLSSSAQKYQDSVQFNNSTIADNYAETDGGGIYLEYANTDNNNQSYVATPLFSTIVGNNSNDAGLNDLAQSTDASSPGAGAFDLSFSLVRAPGNAVITETPAGSNLIGVDPLLGALGDNGGPTETQLPSINSPVVDKGSAPGNLTTDQRGDPRTVDTSPANADDGTDIGSVELATGPPGPPGPPASGQVKVGTLKKKHKKRRRVIRTKHKTAKIRLTFRSSVPGITFRCSVDGGAFAPCASPFTTKLSSAPGKGKNHNIAIQQVDSAGNQVGNVRVFRFRVVLKD